MTEPLSAISDSEIRQTNQAPGERLSPEAELFVPAGSETVIRSPRRSDPIPDATVIAATTSQQDLSQLCLRLFPPNPFGTDEPLPDVSGIVLDHFKLIRRLGSGGMGSVFLAEDLRLRRPVALKVLAPHQARDTSVVKRFQNEAAATARLRHDNVAEVYYVGLDRGLHFIALEFVDGTNLRDIIKERGQMSSAEAVNYGIQVASALGNLNAAGVVHRDIKPSNIIITPRGQAKLIDLGLARLDTSESSQELTVAGTTLGTFDYISPEQAKDPRQADTRSDIYSLGCTLYHMLAGEAPYPEGTVLQKLLDHQSKQTPDLSQKNRRVPRGLCLIIGRMMDSDPAHRYQTTEELLRDLLVAGKALGLSTESATSLLQRWPADRFQNPLKRNASWIASAVVLLAMVAFLQWNPWVFRSPSAASGVRRDNPALTQRTNPTGLDRANNEKNGATPPKAEMNSGLLDPIIPPDSILSDPGIGPKPLVTDIAVASTLPRPPETSEMPVEIPGSLGPKSAGASAEKPAVSATTPSETTETGTAAVPKIEVNGGGTYPRLEAACAEAPSNAVIELRYDGAWSLGAERPIRVNGKNLTIRGEKSRRPIILFDASNFPNDTQMISLSGGSLKLINVEIQIRLPASARGAPCTLFSLERAERLDLENTVITVLNPRRQPMQLINVISVPTPMMSSAVLPKLPGAMNLSEISLRRTLLRGSCDGLVIQDSGPLHFTVDESLVALNGSLIKSLGPSDAFPDNARCDVNLQHSSLFLNGRLIDSMSRDSVEQLLSIYVQATDNVISCCPAPGGGSTLIRLEALGADNQAIDSIHWTGTRNYFDDIDQFLQVRQSFVFSEQSSLSFFDWHKRFQVREEQNMKFEWQGDWKNNSGDWDQITPDEFHLDPEAPRHPMLNGASDGDDAGANPARLPKPSKSPIPR